ncbi:hypothetical protein MTP16_09015 [Hymenobacter monticola]|uniref:Uncharacterized protein n=1 Tax=Hymenobacter monticola TaxID=1705399 RepID=A0ABY4BGK8_9BACT|nr:hypothetical protein [Hymenobacter monticola]UOE35770.1 hypothetical protein MTP16_09015 [Hymenobacter monticola]
MASILAKRWFIFVMSLQFLGQPLADRLMLPSGYFDGALICHILLQWNLILIFICLLGRYYAANAENLDLKRTYTVLGALSSLGALFYLYGYSFYTSNIPSN